MRRLPAAGGGHRARPDRQRGVPSHGPRVFAWLLTALFSLVALSVGGCRRRPPVVPPAARTPIARGIALGLFASAPDYDYGPLLDEIVQHGASDVLIAWEWVQSSPASDDLASLPGRSPSDATIERTLAQAQARGLRVALLPQVGLAHPAPDEWRGRILPEGTEGVERWFQHYGARLLRVAALAEAAGVSRLGIGSELVALEPHADRWRQLIAAVRQRYHGRLFYSANWDHFSSIAFWDALDEVGVTGYFELRPDGSAALPEDAWRPDADELARAWEGPRAALEALHRATGKPVLITEIGYPSLAGAWRFPWNAARPVALDLPLQALLYQSFCDAFAGQGLLAGFYAWNWFGFGGPSDPGYTPRGKPAARVLERCLGRADWNAPGPRP